MGALSDYLDKRWGTRTRQEPNPVVDEIDIAVTEALRNDPDRFSWVFINLSANVIFVGFDREVSATKGIRVAANGGSVGSSADEDGELVGLPVFATAGADNSAVYITTVKKG